MGCVYLITCVPTQQQYVGMTTLTSKRRFSQHCYDSRNHRNFQSKLCDALRQYANTEFVVEEIFHSNDVDQLIERENQEIIIRQTLTNGLNNTLGGECFRKNRYGKRTSKT